MIETRQKLNFVEIVLFDEAVMQGTGGSGDPCSVPGSKLKAALSKKESIIVTPKARMKRISVRRINSCVSQSELCQSSCASNSQLSTKEQQTNSRELSEGLAPNVASASIPVVPASVNSSEPSKIAVTCRPPLSRSIACSIKNIDKHTIQITPISTSSQLETMDCNQLISRNISTNGRVWRYADTPSKFTLRQSILENITLTPVKDTSMAVENSKPEDHKEVTKLVQKRPNVETFVLCKTCGHCNRDFNKCEKCNAVNIGKKPSYETINEANIKNPPPSSPQSSDDKNTLSQPIFFHFKPHHLENLKEGHSENVQNYSGKALSEPPSVPQRHHHVMKSKDVEPECWTISSDEEENTTQLATLTSVEMPGSSVNSAQSQNAERMDIGNSNSMVKNNCNAQAVPKHLCHDHSINVVGSSFDDIADEDEMDRDNEEEDDIEEEDEDEEEEEEEHGQLLEEDEGEEMEENEHRLNIPKKEFDITIMCRSIRIGSFKIHTPNNSFLHLNVNRDGFSFNVPTVISVNEIVTIKLTAKDIVDIMGHFGRCLPILFIYTNATCGDAIRNQLHMNKSDGIYFDPSDLADEKQKRITFLIESITDEHRVFLRHRFPGESLLREIDQKTANEILVRSTPTKPLSSKYHQVMLQAPLSFACPQTSSLSPTITAAVVAPINIPVVKILTYPPPPQTGGIAITNEDLLCLNEGEFLNDVIIDFYLRYLVNEKFSEADRRRTHVFSSFFYPRLTQKPTGKLTTEEEKPSLPVRRHGQVKTWTRHVDIFEKDFIIIPINQNAHWFLAIICFPGLVPENSKILEKVSSSSQIQKSVNKVSSSNDPDCSQALLPPQDSLCVSKKEQACNTEVFTTSSIDVSSMSTSCCSPVIPFEHEVAEPCDPDDPLSDVPDSSTHPDDSSHCKKMPCILIFDSLAGPTRWRIVTILREYLDVEWKIKKSSKKTFDRSTMKGFVPKVPQQSNFSDCGLFLLQYVESFFEKPLPYFGSPMMELNEWFAAEEVAKKRDQLKLLISDLQKKQHPSGTPSIDIRNSAMNESEDKSTSCATVIPLRTIQMQNR